MPYLIPLQIALEAQANAETAYWAKKYMRDQFAFYGIKSPDRQAILKGFLAENGLPPRADLPATLQTMWDAEQREWQYCAMEIFQKSIKKAEETDIDWVESLILQKSWWDTIDFLAPKIAGEIFRQFPALILPTTEKWVNSPQYMATTQCYSFPTALQAKNGL